jgi:hypothetical protein
VCAFRRIDAPGLRVCPRCPRPHNTELSA